MPRSSRSPDEQYVAWTERYQAYVMPFVRSGRSIEVAPEGKALPMSRVSADAGDWLHWAGNSRQLFWTQGPNLYGQTLAGAGAFAGGKQAPAPLVAELGVVSSQVRPSGRLAGPRHESDADRASDDKAKVLRHTEQERGLGADKTP